MMQAVEEVSFSCSKRHSLIVVDFEWRGNLVFFRIAREMLDLEDETPLPGSRLRCFIFLSPLNFRVNCLMWLWMCSSTNF